MNKLKTVQRFPDPLLSQKDHISILNYDFMGIANEVIIEKLIVECIKNLLHENIEIIIEHNNEIKFNNGDKLYVEVKNNYYKKYDLSVIIENQYGKYIFWKSVSYNKINFQKHTQDLLDKLKIYFKLDQIRVSKRY